MRMKDRLRGARNTLLLCLLAAIPLACAGGARVFEPVVAGADRPIVQADRLHRMSLPNGMQVLLLEDHRLPRLSFGVRLRRGAAIEPLAQAGVGSLLSEVMERGAGERDALALAEAVDSLGANLSVHAGWDSFSVHVSGLSRDREALMEVLRDVVRAPRLEPDEMRRAQGEHLAILARGKDEPATLVRWQFARTLFPEHRYGTPMNGQEESVAALDPETLRAFYEQIFNPRNAVFFASGDFDAATFRAAIESAFGDWEGGEVPEPVEPPPAQTPAARRIVVVDRPELAQSRIMLGHEGISRTDDTRITNAIMNGILGGNGFSSRLMKKIRSDEGLTYGIYSGVAMRRRPGAFQISTSTRVSETRRVVDLSLAEVERMMTDPPDADAVAKAKGYAVGHFALGLETTDAVVGALVDLDVHRLPEDSLDTYRGRVRAITEEKVAEQARAFLHPDRAAIVLVGPAAELVPQFEDMGEVEVIQP